MVSRLPALSLRRILQPKHGMLGTTFGGNHLACAAALAVLEVIEKENLIQNAAEIGKYLMEELKKIPQLQNVRGRGLMIGFDVPEELKDLRKNLLWKHKIFTGEAKPNVIGCCLHWPYEKRCRPVTGSHKRRNSDRLT